MRNELGGCIAAIPMILCVLFFGGVIVDAIYETVSCKSRVFMDEGQHHQMRCVTDPKELDSLKPYLHHN